MPEPPTGTVTFLFTDMEGSTRRWEAYPRQMPEVLARHDRLIRTAIEDNGGHVFATAGDAFSAAFAIPTEAVAAAVEAQRAIQAEDWGDLPALRVRMALHTGLASERDGDYFGPPLNRTARILEVARGGQIVVSETSADLLRHVLPDPLRLIDLGEQRLKDLSRPEHLYGLDYGAGPVKVGRRVRALPVAAALLVAALLLFFLAVIPRSFAPSGVETSVAAEVPEALEVLWSQRVDGGPLEPTPADGAVYVGTEDGKLRAFDIGDGEPIWAEPHDAAAAIAGPPVVDDDLVFFTARHGGGDLLVAVEVGSGMRRWRCSLPFLKASPPTLADGWLYLGATGSVHKFEAHPGSDPCLGRSNQTFVQGQVDIEPSVAAGGVYVADRRNVYAFDAGDLEARWESFLAEGAPLEYEPHVTSLRVQELATQTGGGVSRQVRIWATEGARLLRISPESGEVTDQVELGGVPTLGGEVLYAVGSEGDLRSLDAESLNELWRLPLSPSQLPPVVTTGVAFVAGLDGLLHAVDLERRTQIAALPLQAEAVSLVAGDDLVLVIESDGRLTAVAPPQA